VHTDVQRRQPLLDNPLETAWPEIRERHIASVGERKPEIVILQEQRLACILRISVDEAEGALVGALTDGIGRSDDAERFARRLLDLLNDGFGAARRGELDLEGFFVFDETQVVGVPHLRTVDAHIAVSDLEVQLVGYRASLDLGYPYHGLLTGGADLAGPPRLSYCVY
jgi:hypothetical protein